MRVGVGVGVQSVLQRPESAGEMIVCQVEHPECRAASSPTPTTTPTTNPTTDPKLVLVATESAKWLEAARQLVTIEPNLLQLRASLQGLEPTCRGSELSVPIGPCGSCGVW